MTVPFPPSLILRTHIIVALVRIWIEKCIMHPMMHLNAHWQYSYHVAHNRSVKEARNLTEALQVLRPGNNAGLDLCDSVTHVCPLVWNVVCLWRFHSSNLICCSLLLSFLLPSTLLFSHVFSIFFLPLFSSLAESFFFSLAQLLLFSIFSSSSLIAFAHRP